MEKIAWTQYEDSILQFLRQERKMQRWTDISRTLASEFRIKGRNGKDCRERYQQKFNQSGQTLNWSFKDEKELFSLHNELGNKWAVISRLMNGRSDNCIKNHLYSRLRKGLKKLNTVSQEKLGKRFKQIKLNVLFKIIEATEDGFKNNIFCQADTSKLCFELKNKLIELSYEDNQQHDFQPENIDCVEMYESINEFNKNYKRKPKKFRRIPTKNIEMKQQSEEMSEDQLKSTVSQNEKNSDLELETVKEKSKEKNETQHKINSQQLFGQFQQECYKINEAKNLKKRRQSAETTGIQDFLDNSGILEDFPQLPQLILNKKETSYFELMSEQPENHNLFCNFFANQVDECDFNSENFLWKHPTSIKRMSEIEDPLFF